MSTKPWLMTAASLLALGAASACNGSTMAPQRPEAAGLVVLALVARPPAERLGPRPAALAGQRAAPIKGGTVAPPGVPQDPVWTAASLTFTLTSSGGFVAQPPPDSGCNTVSVTHALSAAQRLLVEDGCLPTGPVHHLVHLSQAGTDSIVTGLSAVHTTCTKGCGADAPDMSLTVDTSDSAIVYNSDFYAGCSNSLLSPPFVPFSDLATFRSTLDGLITAACGPADAGGADVGTCT